MRPVTLSVTGVITGCEIAWTFNRGAIDTPTALTSIRNVRGIFGEARQVDPLRLPNHNLQTLHLAAYPG